MAQKPAEAKCCLSDAIGSFLGMGLGSWFNNWAAASLGEGEIEICPESGLESSQSQAQPDLVLADMRLPHPPVLPSGPHTLCSSTDAGVASEDVAAPHCKLSPPPPAASMLQEPGAVLWIRRQLKQQRLRQL